MRLRYIRGRIGSAVHSASRSRKRNGGGFLLLVTALVLLIVTIVALSRLRPVLLEIAEGAVTDVVSVSVNDVITDLMRTEKISYSDLVTLEKDSTGNVSALRTDMARINMLQAEISNQVVQALNAQESTVVRIPIGNVLGGALLSGRGPKIPIKVLSVTNVNTHFYNEFASAGINQTQHQMMLNVDVALSILLPGGTSEVHADTQVCLAETIIVGDVPQTYADLGGKNNGE